MLTLCSCSSVLGSSLPCHAVHNSSPHVALVSAPAFDAGIVFCRLVCIGREALSHLPQSLSRAVQLCSSLSSLGSFVLFVVCRGVIRELRASSAVPLRMLVVKRFQNLPLTLRFAALPAWLGAPCQLSDFLWNCSAVQSCSRSYSMFSSVSSQSRVFLSKPIFGGPVLFVLPSVTRALRESCFHRASALI